LTRKIAICNHLHVISTQTPDPSNPTLAIAERQLTQLGELAEMGMVAARAFTASAVASAKAEETILGAEWFTPEVGRAKACGARDAAESIQKVSRAVRLTLMLEMKVAEIVRDIRAGVITYSGFLGAPKTAGETPADHGALQDRQSLSRPASRDPAGSSCRDRDRERAPDRLDAERPEFERPDILPRGSFREVFETLRADIGAAPDAVVTGPKPTSDPFQPRPPGHEARPPASRLRRPVFEVAEPPGPRPP
jgi:hypothetical protein